MWVQLKHIGFVGISLAVVAVVAGDAQAQRFGFQMSGRFNMTAPRCFSGRADTYHCSPGRRSYSSSGSLYTRYTPSYGYGPSSGYGPYEGPTADPYGGYLRGAADIIGAQGRMLVTQQHSMLTAERVSQARLETRRREFDEWLYERANRPTREDDREGVQQQELRRSRNDPPLAEIYSGIALNTLLAELQKLEGRGVRAPETPLAEDVVRQINVTTGNGGAHVGLLKNEGKLDWPIALRIYLPREQRSRVADLAQESMQDAKNGKQAAALREMDRTVRQLHLKLRELAAEIPPGQFIEAKQFLNQLDDAVRALQGADATDYVNGKYAARGGSVAELVQHMTKEGLQFAPAVAGDEAGYLALHRALVAYETQAQAVLVAER